MQPTKSNDICQYDKVHVFAKSRYIGTVCNTTRQEILKALPYGVFQPIPGSNQATHDTFSA